MAKCTLVVSANGIFLTYLDDKTKSKILYDIQDISYCSAESPPQERVFSWICKNAAVKKLECHAVVCGSQDKAQAISLCLSQAFQVAYRDWKTHKEKLERMKQNRLKDVGQSSTSEREEMGNGKEEFGPGKEELGNGKLSAKEEAELNAALAQMAFVEEEELHLEETARS